MIPKIIHYCWVGNAPKPKSVLYCIESWKKFCPDYEIKEWNESNYDFSKNHYMKQAYDAKKWGFVPDYARLDIIYQYGGIYLDTDVELVKSFDELLDQDAFMGFENTGDGEYFVNCGQGFGAVPKHEIIRAARDLYDDLDFINSDGTLNMLASPHYTTQTLCEFGLEQKDKEQKLLNMTIYKSDVLCPKNFRTGKLNVTDKTISIHHFTASWLDDQIKKEMEYQRKMKNIFGDRHAGKVMSLHSVLKKYASPEMIGKIPKATVRKAKDKVIKLREDYPYEKELKIAKKTIPGKGKAIILDTAMDSDNTGDQIIMENCEKQLQNLMDIDHMIRLPTHRFLKDEEIQELYKSSYKILCGTNILSGHMRNYGLWKLNAKIAPYCNTVLMGIGMSSYDDRFDKYTKEMLSTILSKEYLHSVRDSYSEEILHKMGIKNVINTGCPTMWNLTPEHCIKIPIRKSKNVICTITDYNQDIERDQKMFDILVENYNQVFVWIQGDYDEQYIKRLNLDRKIVIVERGLEALDNILKQDNLDYVGTRLHAGIRALSFGHRSIIISIDNRAESIAKDTGLPIVYREDVNSKLEKKIQSEFVTKITLPVDNIERWKRQFKK